MMYATGSYHVKGIEHLQMMLNDLVENRTYSQTCAQNTDYGNIPRNHSGDADMGRSLAFNGSWFPSQPQTYPQVHPQQQMTRPPPPYPGVRNNHIHNMNIPGMGPVPPQAYYRNHPSPILPFQQNFTHDRAFQYSTQGLQQSQCSYPDHRLQMGFPGPCATPAPRNHMSGPPDFYPPDTIQKNSRMSLHSTDDPMLASFLSREGNDLHIPSKEYYYAKYRNLVMKNHEYQIITFDDFYKGCVQRLLLRRERKKQELRQKNQMEDGLCDKQMLGRWYREPEEAKEVVSQDYGGHAQHQGNSCLFTSDLSSVRREISPEVVGSGDGIHSIQAEPPDVPAPGDNMVDPDPQECKLDRENVDKTNVMTSDSGVSGGSLDKTMNTDGSKTERMWCLSNSSKKTPSRRGSLKLKFQFRTPHNDDMKRLKHPLSSERRMRKRKQKHPSRKNSLNHEYLVMEKEDSDSDPCVLLSSEGNTRSRDDISEEEINPDLSELKQSAGKEDIVEKNLLRENEAMNTKSETAPCSVKEKESITNDLPMPKPDSERHDMTSRMMKRSISPSESERSTSCSPSKKSKPAVICSTVLTDTSDDFEDKLVIDENGDDSEDKMIIDENGDDSEDKMIIDENVDDNNNDSDINKPDALCLKGIAEADLDNGTPDCEEVEGCTGEMIECGKPHSSDTRQLLDKEKPDSIVSPLEGEQICSMQSMTSPLFYAVFHSQKLLCLNKSTAQYFITSELLHKCFDESVTAKKGNVSSKFGHVLTAKSRDLHIPHIELVSVYREEIQRYLTIQQYSSAKRKHVGIIQTGDAHRLYQYFHGMKNCNDLCIQPCHTTQEMFDSQGRIIIHSKEDRLKSLLTTLNESSTSSCTNTPQMQSSNCKEHEALAEETNSFSMYECQPVQMKNATSLSTPDRSENVETEVCCSPCRQEPSSVEKDTEADEGANDLPQIVIKGGIAPLFGSNFRFMVVDSIKYFVYEDLKAFFSKETLIKCLKESKAKNSKVNAIMCSKEEASFLTRLEPALLTVEENYPVLEERLLYEAYDAWTANKGIWMAYDTRNANCYHNMQDRDVSHGAKENVQTMETLNDGHIDTSKGAVTEKFTSDLSNTANHDATRKGSSLERELGSDMELVPVRNSHGLEMSGRVGKDLEYFALTAVGNVPLTSVKDTVYKMILQVLREKVESPQNKKSDSYMDLICRCKDSCRVYHNKMYAAFSQLVHQNDTLKDELDLLTKNVKKLKEDTAGLRSECQQYLENVEKMERMDC